MAQGEKLNLNFCLMVESVLIISLGFGIRRYRARTLRQNKLRGNTLPSIILKLHAFRFALQLVSVRGNVRGRVIKHKYQTRVAHRRASLKLAYEKDYVKADLSQHRRDDFAVF